jgi:hypothetical protein
MRRRVAIATLLVGLGARPAAGQDRFEVQVYDAETAAPGATGIEIHLNHVAVGTRAASPDGELPTQHVTHVTFEPHVGVTRFCELGLYVQTAVRPDGLIDFAGIKQRAKLRLPRRFAGFGFALNFELSEVPETYEANRYGSEVRPVVDVRWRRVYASVNPIVALDFAGALAGRPQLQPAAKVAIEAGAGLAVGVEYYGALGAIGLFASPAAQSHTLYGVLDGNFAVGGVPIALNAGAGYDFTGVDRWVVKAILGVGH